MPPLNSGAPTTGNAALAYWSILGVAVLLGVIFGFLKYMRPSGESTAQREERSDNVAIATLQDTVKELKETNKQQHAQHEERIKDLETQLARKNADDSHTARVMQAMMGQMQLLVLNHDIAVRLLRRILSEWHEMPESLREEANQLKPASAILDQIPLPVRKE
jgi:hypothetical protein